MCDERKGRELLHFAGPRFFFELPDENFFLFQNIYPIYIRMKNKHEEVLHICVLISDSYFSIEQSNLLSTIYYILIKIMYNSIIFSSFFWEINVIQLFKIYFVSFAIPSSHRGEILWLIICKATCSKIWNQSLCKQQKMKRYTYTSNYSCLYVTWLC